MSTHPDHHPELHNLTRYEEKIVSALRSGGFACFLPKTISSGVLRGFPERLVYVGGLIATDRLRVVVTEYSWDGYSYTDNEEFRELLYFSETVEWFTAVKFDKCTSKWEATKYAGSWELGDSCRGRELALSTAPNLEQLLIHATMVGPDPGEPLLSLEDYDGEDVDRVFICPVTRAEGHL